MFSNGSSRNAIRRSSCSFFFVLNEFELDAIKYVLYWEASCSNTVKKQNNIAYIENAEAVESTQLLFVC